MALATGLLFDPEEGVVVRQPLGSGEGWWVGAAGALYDTLSRRFYLTYRYRRPRGVEPDRGGELVIAESEDGVHFHDLWRLTKGELGSPSIERCCLRRLAEDRWCLWVSYVDPADHRWRIDALEAPAPDAFDPAARRKALAAPELGIEGIKDPWVMPVGPAYWMVVSYAERAPGAEAASDRDLHHHADAYDTGLILSHSGLAVSLDARQWQWLGCILAAQRPEQDWDGYSARIGCVLRTGDCWTAYYDGAIGVRNHYDETTGLAVSFDLRQWTRLTPEAPVLASPRGTGCCRYFDALEVEGTRFVYYEYGRADGSHELRVRVGPC